ncbi:MAG TPA: RNA-binding cell elongation regulator Jag/EloR [Candidatus Margulisiibacteriota bacterium]|nr:RNA-binding cell elongation regulator Jag/EloR [Candidatus Margulisiibacteriota bacterium]
MNSVEADGSSIDEAIDSALKLLGATRDRVEIEILNNAVRGWFGIGGRKARVRATLRAPIDADHSTRSAPVLPATAAAPLASTRERTVMTAEDHGAVDRARHVLEEILRHVDVQAAVNVRQEGGDVLFELTGDTSGVLIGRRGQMLDALEYLLNRIATRDEGGAARITVDSENYRTRRRAALEELARRMGEQAKRKRKAITLNPMSPRDRRIVHMILQEDKSLVTKSSGKGYFRKLIIIPAGMSKRRPDAAEPE